MRYDICPVPKPRMTQRDKWKKRPAVQRYYAFKDAVRLSKIEVPKAGAHVVFHIPMPKSWSKKKCWNMCGTPHEQKPDLDNYLKALLDAIYNDDSGVWDIKATKLWAKDGAITVTTNSAETIVDNN